MSSHLDNPEISVQPPEKVKQESAQHNFDAQHLAALFQCIGFVVQSMDRVPDTEFLQRMMVNNEDVIKIDITCSKSGMKATLVKNSPVCQCPPVDDASNAQFWNISGCDPSMQGNVSVSKSTLIPSISVGKTSTINMMLLKCIDFIILPLKNDNVDITDDFKIASTMARQKSTDALKVCDATSSKLATGLTPPKDSSSPIPDMCSSSKNPSIVMDDSMTKVADILGSIEKLCREASDILGLQNTTFTKVPRLSDVKISPLVGTSSMINIDKSFTKNTSMNKFTPGRLTPRKPPASSGDKRKAILPTSRLNIMKAKRTQELPSTSFGKMLTPRAGFSKEADGKSPGVAVKVKPIAKVDSYLKSKLKAPDAVSKLAKRQS